MKQWYLLFLLLILGVWVKHSQAQAGMTARFSAEAGTYTVGDVIPVALIVTHPTGFRVIPPDWEREWGEFEVRSWTAPTIEKSAESETEVTTLYVELVAWKPGQYNLPVYNVEISNGNGQVAEISAETAVIMVNALLDPTNAELKDIKPQAKLPIPIDWPRYATVAAAVDGVVLLFVCGIARLFFHPMPAHSGIDTRPPHVIALSDLQEVMLSRLPQKGEFEQHYILVTDVLRRYLEREYQISAMDKTTYEIGRTLAETSSLSAAQIKRLTSLLQNADLVKFATFKPEVDSAITFVEKARELVVEYHQQLTSQPEQPSEVSP